jgi:hypothetical protein
MATLASIVAARWDDASENVREWAAARTPKDDVSDWESVGNYFVVCPDGDGESLVEIQVWVGQTEDVWYVRTTDDAGGGDDFPDRPYVSEEAATEAALKFAEEHDETPDLDSLVKEVCEARDLDEATGRRIVGEITSIPEHSGMRLDVFASGHTVTMPVQRLQFWNGSPPLSPNEVRRL